MLLLSDFVLELLVPLVPVLELLPDTLISEVTLVTPWVSRASAMARPTASGWSTEPVRVTSPLLASAWMLALVSWLSACILPVTMVFKTVSSVVPVGEPAVDSLVRTIATPLSRSLLSSDGLRRHSVMRAEISPLAMALLAAVDVASVVELVAPATDADGDVAFAADVVSVEDALPVVPAPATVPEELVVSVAGDADVDAAPYVELVPEAALVPVVPAGDSVPATPDVPVEP